ncbi:MAG: hypothetical protein AAF288_13985 [Planctomycetota bacterium]
MTDRPTNPSPDSDPTSGPPLEAAGAQPAPEAPSAATPLCDSDAAALDALLGARALGVDVLSGAGPVPAEAADRAPGVRQLLGLLDQFSQGDAERCTAPNDLCTRTIEALREARERDRLAEQVQAFAQGPRAIAFSWRQLAAAAAALLLGAAMLIPVLSRDQAQAQQIACRSNLGSIGQAFGAYAVSNRGELPRYEVQPGGVWWNVGAGAGAGASEGPVQSNASHLFILMHEGRVRLDQLACASRKDAVYGRALANQRDWSRPADVSYSYQNQYRTEATQLDLNPRLVVLADKNPLLRSRDDGQGMFHDTAIDRDAVSEAHGDAGQNLLLADGSAQWASRSTLDTGRSDADNLWTPMDADPARAMTGTEVPESASFDSFLVP